MRRIWLRLKKFYMNKIEQKLEDLIVALKKKNIFRNRNRLAELKNTKQGQRCFIVATGPSIQISDLEMLRGEITFSVNSIVTSYDKMTWRPTYYGIQDNNVYKKIKGLINPKDYQAMFVGDPVKVDKKTIQNNVYKYHINFCGHKYNERVPLNSKFSDNASIVVYDGYTIVYSMIQIAVYMGFKKIYLLGCDCNYNGNSKHFGDTVFEDNNYSLAGDQMIYAYQFAKRYADNNNIEIYNATRGGMLEIFPRVKFDELFEKNT